MTVYAKFENGELITARNGYNNITGLAESPKLCLANGFVAYDEILIAKYFAGQAEIQNGNLIDISDTDDYKAKIQALENVRVKADLEAQIGEFDRKRIRAGFEPSTKDELTGQTWLEYYTQQIADLRAQIAQLG